MEVYKQCLIEENNSGFRVKVICGGKYLKCKYQELGVNDELSDEVSDLKDQVGIKANRTLVHIWLFLGSRLTEILSLLFFTRKKIPVLLKNDALPDAISFLISGHFPIADKISWIQKNLFHK